MSEPGRTGTKELVAFALAAALVPLNSTMVAVALPAIGHDLDIAPSVLTQWLVTSYLLVGIVCQSPAGKMGDLVGHRRALSIGQATFSAGAILGFFATTLLALTGARVLMAAGGAIMAPSVMALLRTELPPETRGRAFGLFGAVMGLSAALGPLIGGVISTHFGWTSIFAANVPPLVVSVALAYHPRGPRPAPTKRPVFDVVGSITLGLGLGLLIAGLRGKSASSHLFVPIGVVLLGGFAWWETRVADPVVDLRTFGVKAFSAGAALIALQNLAMYALLFELPVFTADVLHAGANVAGRLLLAMTAAMVVGSPLGGRAAERFGAKTVAVSGATISSLGAAILALTSATRALHLVFPLLLVGFGLGLCTAPSQAAALGAVPAEKSGMAAGVMSTTRYLGGVLGVFVLGSVLVPGGDMASEHRFACAIFAASFVLSGFAALGLPRANPPSTNPLSLAKAPRA